MPILNLSRGVKITRVMNSQAAATTDVNSSTIDMANWEGVVFIAAVGALTATQVTQIKAQQGQLADASDMADLAGSNTGPFADADGNKMLVLDLYQPQERYVRCVVDRGTANAVVDGVIAIQYGSRKAPTTHDTSVKATKFLQSPAEGTA